MDKTSYRIIIGDALTELRKLPSDSVHCCVTSPPYWQLRDYEVAGQLGLEQTPEEYVATMREVFAEVRRVLRPDGTLWLDIGDTYASSSSSPRRNEIGKGLTPHGNRVPSNARLAGLKDKDLIGIPWRTALALQADGWYLRSDIIWHKPNALPESVKDRPTKSHEYLFLLTKNKRYHYDADAIREQHQASSLKKQYAPWYGRRWYGAPNGSKQSLKPGQSCHPRGKNKRSVWSVPSRGFPGAHFSTFPEKLVEPCILAGCPVGGTVLDPFVGTGTVMAVAMRLNRRSIGIELKEEYARLARERLLRDVR